MRFADAPQLSTTEIEGSNRISVLLLGPSHFDSARGKLALRTISPANPMTTNESAAEQRASKASAPAPATDRYVGRDRAVAQLHDLLAAGEARQSNVLIQSIEGPGGIGKTALFEHVLDKVDRKSRGMLVMRVTGDQATQRDAFESVHALITSSEAPQTTKTPISRRFANTEEVRAIYNGLLKDARKELQLALPDVPIDQLMRLMRAGVEAGQRINVVVPRSHDYVDFDRLEKYMPAIEEALKSTKALMDEFPGWLEKLGATKSAALRNSVRANALNALAEAFVGDLTALIAGYDKKDVMRPAQAKAPGLDRLILVFDDYESLATHLGEFLVNQLVPKLKSCPFETTLVIVGRDQLALTHPGWNQHHQRSLAPAIALTALSRPEMDQLVRAYGRSGAEDLDRAWNDTLGYPLLVTLWLDEALEAGREGPSIGMLKRFHDRTTHWLTEEQKRWLYHALFLPKVNVETFGAALGSEDEGRLAMQWFEGDGSVRDAQSRAFRVRPYVRSRLAEYLEAIDPARFRHLSARGDAAIVDGAA